jgi:hypothetical protein
MYGSFQFSYHTRHITKKTTCHYDSITTTAKRIEGAAGISQKFPFLLNVQIKIFAWVVFRFNLYMSYIFWFQSNLNMDATH